MTTESVTDYDIGTLCGIELTRLEARCDANKNFAIGEPFARSLIYLLREAERRLCARPEIAAIGYAVQMADGNFVGIWKDRAIAEQVCAKQPPSHGDRVVPMYAAPPESAKDTERLNFLEEDVKDDPLLLFHQDPPGGNKGFRGLGLSCTGRTLRRALDQIISAMRPRETH